MAEFHLHLLLTVCAYGCMHVRVILPDDWMAVPPRIVELEGSSSYTLIMAWRWRIPEASSLIDSSVLFLPRPCWAEARYCPAMRCKQARKQPASHQTHCAPRAQDVQMESEQQRNIPGPSQRCTYLRTPVAHMISRRLSHAESFFGCSHSLSFNPNLSEETQHFMKPKVPVCVYVCLFLLLWLCVLDK